MTSFKFKFRESTCEGREGRIYYQVIHERVVRQWNTDYRLLPEEWDRKRGEVAIAPGSERSDYLQSVRQRMRWDADRMNRILTDLIRKRGTFTADEAVAEFSARRDEQSFFNFMEGAIVKLQERGKTRTSETYKTALSSLRRFREDEDIMLDGFDSDLMEEYEAYMARHGLVPNTRSFHFRILRAVYNRAVEKELTENRRPFRHVYTGVDKTAKRAIGMEMMRRIKEADLRQMPVAEYARDMFMLSFYLRGMSYVDMAYLGKGNLVNGYVTYRRRKTGQRLQIKWTAEMEEIVRRYPENETDYLLPIITKAGTASQTQFRTKQQKINVGLKRVGEMVGVGMPLTLYCSRHSWASIARESGVPIGVISDGLGHDSEMTTQIYLASLDTREVDRANEKIIALL